jgi:hypothetical protein
VIAYKKEAPLFGVTNLAFIPVDASKGINARFVILNRRASFFVINSRN